MQHYCKHWHQSQRQLQNLFWRATGQPAGQRSEIIVRDKTMLHAVWFHWLLRCRSHRTR
jgi:hypothetical protein